MLFCRRTVVSIPCGPSALAVKEAAWGLARYAAISQVCYSRFVLLYKNKSMVKERVDLLSDNLM